MAKTIQFKVERDRVLVPVGEACSFGCKYCYTRGGEVGPPKVKREEILHELKKFSQTAKFGLIQFGYDGDPFVRPERGIWMLQELANLGKHITFSTKALIEGSLLEQLAAIQQEMASQNTIMVALISLSCWESAYHIEPHTPTPKERMQTVSNLKKAGIPTFIALRPILPNIGDDEYEQVIDEGIRASIDGFILGPLYGDIKRKFVRFIPADMLEQTPALIGTVPWSAHAPTWTRYENTLRLQHIAHMIYAKQSQVLLSSADVIAFVQGRKVLV